ncbi:MAG TPA: gliding motility-associated C-terminal domain-containing protein [Bacteroidia bacterium]|nr:gliding motility-associated C-terminal domain-containing protein [Bacteroidia bacterium]
MKTIDFILKKIPQWKWLPLLALTFNLSLNAQEKWTDEELEKRFPFVNYVFDEDSLQGFDWEKINQIVQNDEHLQNKNSFEYKFFLYNMKRSFIIEKYHLYEKNFNNKFNNTTTIQTAACNNEDFEQGNFNGWTVSGSAPAVIKTTPFNDPIVGPIPNSPLGGTQVAQLNNLAGGYLTTTISKTFVVGSSNTFFQIAFLAILQDPGHACSCQPKFTLQVSVNGNPLGCPNFNIVAGPCSNYGCPTWQNAGGTVYNPTWQVATLDLTPYMGQNVTITISAIDCCAGGHGGMVYVDALCGDNTITNQILNNCGPTATVTALPMQGNYNWNGPSGSGIVNYTGATFTTNVPGTYTLNISGPCYCAPLIKTVQVNMVPLPLTGLTTQKNCRTFTITNTGDPAPSVQSYTITGGTPSTFTTSSPTSVVSFANGGIYTIYQEINNGTCKGTYSTNITVPFDPVLNVATNSVSCYGYSDGSAVVSANNGTSPYNFTLIPSAGIGNVSSNDYNISNIPANNYTVNVVDAAGCSSSINFNIAQPTPITLSVSSTPASCYAFSDGSASVQASGGTGTYIYYEWQPFGGSGPGMSTANYIPAGTYSVKVTDANYCISTQTVQVSQPPAISVSVVSQSISCYMGSDGSATVTASGGTSPFTYSWNPSVSATNVINNVPYNTYTCTIIDNNGCSKIEYIPINQPPQVKFQFSKVPDRCYQNNGIIISNIQGGSPPYQYQWSNGATTPSIGGLTGNVVYTLTITDAHNCVYSDTVYLPRPNTPTITALTFTPPLCNSGNNGIISGSSTGGTSPMYYTWLPYNNIHDTILTGVSAGTYTFVVTDYYGCTTSSIITVTQPTPINLNVTPDQLICYGNTVNIFANASNGTPPYQYFWNSGSGMNGSGPQPFTFTTTTTFTVFAQDTNGCKSLPKIITISVKPPLKLKDDTIWICSESQYTLHPYVILPGNGGNYQWTWNTGANTQEIVITGDYNNQPQIYSVYVDDGCTQPGDTGYFVVNVHPKPNGQFSADVRQGCPPLIVTFTAQSTNSNDTYFWNFGNGNTIGGNNVSTTYEGVGMYPVSLYVTNQYGCRWDTTIQNYIQVYSQPIADFEPYPSIATIDNPIINFTNLSLYADYYQWYFGDPYSSDNVSTEQHPYHVYDLAGDYDVYLVATNQYGCKDIAKKKVRIEPIYSVYIPDVFTPDGNGLNDVFNIKGVGISEEGFLMQIFDRWGELIYQTRDLYKGWNGTNKRGGKAKQDVYVYKIYTQDVKGNKYEYTGHVTCLPGS